MNCPKCNGEIKPGEKYCSRCGTPVIDEKSEKDEKKTEKKNTGKNRKSGKKGKKGKKGLFLPLGLGIFCVLIIVIVGLVAAPKQTTADKLQEKLDLGNNYLEKADYVKAKVAFSDALEIDDKSPEAALGMADAYNGQKKPDQALKYLKKASKSVKTASEKKDAVHVPKDTTDFSSHYEKACNETANQYKSSNNISKQKETKDIIKEFKTIVIYVPENDTSATPVPTKKVTKKASDQTIKQETKEEKTPEEPEESEGIDEEKVADAGMAVVTVTPEEEATEIPESITPTPEEAIDISKIEEVTPTPTEITPTPEESRVEVFEDAKDGGGNSPDIPEPDNEYVYDPETGEETYRDLNGEIENAEEENPASYGEQEGQEPGTIAGEENVNEENDPNSTVNMNNDSGQDNTGAEEQGETEIPEEVSPEEILDNYVQTVLAQNPKASLNGTSVAYTYGDNSTVNTALNGMVGIQETDLDKDGIPELLVISMQNGKMSFTVYRINNGEVEAGSPVTAADDGTGIALADCDYGFTQECFMKDNGDGYVIGFSSYVYGTDGGDGSPIPIARTSVEAYKINPDGTTTQLSEENAALLAGINPADDSEQNLSSESNPLAAGLATTENGVQDLVIISGNMSAGTGSLSFDQQDHTTFAK